MSPVDKRHKQVTIIPLQERRRIRDSRIMSMHRNGYSMNEIVKVLGVSKQTVFFVVGRSKKKVKGPKKN